MSLPQYVKVQTSCKDCVFALYEGDTQYGCDFARTDKFKEKGKLIEAKDDLKEFFVIDGFCNRYRTKDWGAWAEGENAEEAVINETSPTFGLVVYDSQNKISFLDGAIASLKKVNYDKSKINVVISSYVEKDCVDLIVKVEDLKKDGFKASVVFNYENSTQAMIDKAAFQKCIGYHYLGKMEHFSIIDPDYFKKVDKSLNDDLEQIILFEKDGVSFLPFRVVNSEYLNYQDFKKMVREIRPLAKQHNMYLGV